MHIKIKDNLSLSLILSYNMKYHYETVHKNSTLPSEFIIPDSEIKNVKKKF